MFYLLLIKVSVGVEGNISLCPTILFFSEAEQISANIGEEVENACNIF